MKRRDSKLSANVLRFMSASHASNTRSAYDYDVRMFIRWGGRIPASPEMLANYLAEHADQLAVATLTRRVAAINHVHAELGVPSPSHSDVVKNTLRGIRRLKGSSQRRVHPISLKELGRMVNGLNGLKGVRDKAILLLGFYGALRRSELVAIKFDDLEFSRRGMLVRLAKSKTDPFGEGRSVAIPLQRVASRCPVIAIKNWLKAAGIKSGYVFRHIDRHQNVGESLSARVVALIIKERAAAIGLDPAQYSGHSMRSGLVTSAAISGASTWAIRQQTGHKSDGMLQRYIRNVDPFDVYPALTKGRAA